MFDRHLGVCNAGFLVTPLGSGCQLGYYLFDRHLAVCVMQVSWLRP
jgi:hypothetical protein